MERSGHRRAVRVSGKKLKCCNVDDLMQDMQDQHQETEGLGVSRHIRTPNNGLALWLVAKGCRPHSLCLRVAPAQAPCN